VHGIQLNKRGEYRFAGATRKVESSAVRVCKDTAIINYAWVEYVGGNDILKFLHASVLERRSSFFTSGINTIQSKMSVNGWDTKAK
jgi:hypothetical protein